MRLYCEAPGCMAEAKFTLSPDTTRPSLRLHLCFPHFEKRGDL